MPYQSPRSAPASRSRRLVVISNRVSLPGAANVGGLAVAMDGALRKTGGVWFGWSGDAVAEPQTHEVRDGRVHYVTRDLTPDTLRDYYHGYANRTLWPLLHGRCDLLAYETAWRDAYHAVNADFADALVARLEPDDDIWIHDYHLIPLGRLLRERGVRSRIGFFLHVPVPPAASLATLPGHLDLLSALASYDVVGLQTQDDVRALRDYFSQHRLSAATRIGCFPISIDARAVAAAAESAATLQPCTELERSLDGRALMLGVDRLDYSKGLPQRFTSFGRLLDQHAELRGQVTLVQIAPGSRTEVPEYQTLARELEGIAGAINGRLADPTWTPIRYVSRNIAQDVLAGFYRSARVGVVTPLRDGMNLVAKEYVAAQDPADPGVLVLSTFAGAARELDVGALLVNPHDVESCAEAYLAALRMPLDERRRRWRAMMDVLERHDLHAWTRSFLAALAPPVDAIAVDEPVPHRVRKSAPVRHETAPRDWPLLAAPAI